MKRQSPRRFLQKIVLKKFTYDSATRKECNTKKMQHEKRATQKTA